MIRQIRYQIDENRIKFVNKNIWRTDVAVILNTLRIEFDFLINIGLGYLNPHLQFFIGTIKNFT